MNSIAEDDELDVLQVAGCIEALVYRTYDDAFHAGKEGLTIFQGMYDLGELRTLVGLSSRLVELMSW